jgi:hypothetical protein
MFPSTSFPEPEYSEASSLQPSGSTFVTGAAARAIVLPAINLDRKANCRTVEIHDVAAERMLAAKAQAGHLTALQDVPELLFCMRGATAKASGSGGRLRRPRKP